MWQHWAISHLAQSIVPVVGDESSNLIFAWNLQAGNVPNPLSIGQENFNVGAGNSGNFGNGIYFTQLPGSGAKAIDSTSPQGDAKENNGASVVSCSHPIVFSWLALGNVYPTMRIRSNPARL